MKPFLLFFYNVLLSVSAGISELAVHIKEVEYVESIILPISYKLTYISNLDQINNPRMHDYHKM